MPTRLEQSTEARLQEIADVFSSGQTELTGHVRRLDTGEIAGRFKGGAKLLYPELKYFPETPGRIAEAIRKRSGRLYDRLQQAVRGELSDVIPERRRRIERPTIPPHDALTKRCKVCGDYHGKNAHRFHGRGAYLQTHLFPFKNNMSVSNARQLFARLMKVSRARALSPRERLELRRVSQVLRADRKSGRRNPAPRPPEKSAWIRFLEFKGFLPSSLRPDIVKELFRKRPALRREFYEWQKGGSLIDPPTLFKNKRRRRRQPKRNAVKSGRLVRLGKLIELRYERDHGRHRGFYKHHFKSKPTLYFDREKNTIIAR
jgi:hypothetical protein